MALAAITMVASRLYATEWLRDLNILVYLTFLAGVAGLAFGYSRFSPLVCALFSSVYGLFIAGLLFGTTVDIEMPWRERIINYLGWRLRLAIIQFRSGESLTDPILFLSIMAILLWILGSSAAFILVRQGSVWPSLIPLGFTILVIGHYDQSPGRNARFLITFLFLTLLILGRMTFLRFRQNWRQEGIHTTTKTHADLTKTLVILAFALLLLTWLIPINPSQRAYYSQFWKSLSDRWDHLSDQISDIFVVEKSTRIATSGSFGDAMGLGNSAPISEETVFFAKAGSNPPEGYRHYWRALSYDNYDNAVWSFGAGLEDSYLSPENFRIQYPQWEGSQKANYAFSINANRLGNFYSPGLPTWVNRPVEAIIHSLSGSEQDLIALIADPEMIVGETYQVQTLINLPSMNELRRSSTDYPAWIDRYLQLPDHFSPKIEALAIEITEQHDNPYSKTNAITRYLRLNIAYARSIPPIPAGMDPIEWFLFDGKTGFCNYYATAQVLMLRSLGIPSRLAVGFAEGEYDPQTDTYTVRQYNSHAWPEVYFVEYGWVAFEPTVSEAPLFLPAVRQPADDELEMVQLEDLPLLDLPPENFDTRMSDISDMSSGSVDTTEEQPLSPTEEIISNRSPWVIVLIAILLSAIIRLLIINVKPLLAFLERMLAKWGKTVPNWMRRLYYRTKMSAAEKAYNKLGQAIRIMGQPLNPANTPTERAVTLIKILPGSRIPAQDIVKEYHFDLFSEHFVNEIRVKAAARLVRKLAIQARLRKIFHLENI